MGRSVERRRGRETNGRGFGARVVLRSSALALLFLVPVGVGHYPELGKDVQLPLPRAPRIPFDLVVEQAVTTAESLPRLRSLLIFC